MDNVIYNCFMRAFFWGCGSGLGTRRLKDLEPINRLVSIELIGIQGFVSMNKNIKENYYLRVFYWKQNRWVYTKSIALYIKNGSNKYYDSNKEMGVIVLNGDVIGRGCLICLKGEKSEDGIMTCVSQVGLRVFPLIGDDNKHRGFVLMDIKLKD